MRITGITEAKFRALREQLVSSHQAEVAGTDDGTITGHGVTAEYHFDSANQTLSVNVKHHPFFIPVSAIESQLREAIDKAS